jgi:hypothetical protein
MCYNLTTIEKDLADLAFADLTPYLKDKLDGQEASDTNQLLHHALPYENHAKSTNSRTMLTRTRRSTKFTSWRKRPMMRRVMKFV